ncbi:MAG: hypothetical protein Q9175_006924 [Cornicularia normoerica]
MSVSGVSLLIDRISGLLNLAVVAVEEGDDAAGEEVGESHVDDDDDVTPIEEEAQVEGEEEEGGLQ